MLRSRSRFLKQISASQHVTVINEFSPFYIYNHGHCQLSVVNWSLHFPKRSWNPPIVRDWCCFNSLWDCVMELIQNLSTAVCLLLWFYCWEPFLQYSSIHILLCCLLNFVTTSFDCLYFTCSARYIRCAWALRGLDIHIHEVWDTIVS